MRFSDIRDMTTYVQECLPDEEIDDVVVREALMYMCDNLGYAQKRFNEEWSVEELNQLTWTAIGFAPLDDEEPGIVYAHYLTETSPLYAF